MVVLLEMVFTRAMQQWFKAYLAVTAQRCCHSDHDEKQATGAVSAVGNLRHTPVRLWD
jgi:hypothetical protein